MFRSVKINDPLAINRMQEALKGHNTILIVDQFTGTAHLDHTLFRMHPIVFNLRDLTGACHGGKALRDTVKIVRGYMVHHVFEASGGALDVADA